MPSPTTLKLPDDLKSRLAALAEAEGKTPHAYMLDALREAVDRADRRAAYLEAGAAAEREYERTGIAYAFEDVKEYFLALASGQKAPKPRPKQSRPRKKS